MNMNTVTASDWQGKLADMGACQEAMARVQAS